ncbi:MAG: PQQ-binding-like beta-propeller repeat protein [Planctomycetes bacterium]|nr:PQQ-binding-like beta-propeller repeat protein [Planctomycetota bacterium]
MRPLLAALCASLAFAAGCRAVPESGDNPLLAAGRKPTFSQVQLDKINFDLHWEAVLPGKRLKGCWLLGEAIYVSTADHLLYSVGLSDGMVRWIYDVGDEVSFSPAVYRYEQDEVSGLNRYDELYVISKDRLLCLDREIGALNWSLILPFAAASPPSASETHVYVGSWDDRIYAINKETRVETWRFRTSGDVTSMAVYGGRTTPAVYFASEDGQVYLADPVKGRERQHWQFRTDGPILADLVYDRKKVYVASTDFNVYALNAEDGKMEWRVPMGASVSQPPVVVGDTVYAVAEGQHLHAIHRRRSQEEDEGEFYAGDEMWRIPQGVQVLAVGRREVYILDSAKQVSAVDHATGETVWKYPFKDVRYFLSNPANPESRDEAEQLRAGVIVLGYANGWLFGLKEKPRY